MYCGNCGKEILNENSFCTGCGKKIVVQPEEAAMPTKSVDGAISSSSNYAWLKGVVIFVFLLWGIGFLFNLVVNGYFLQLYSDVFGPKMDVSTWYRGVDEDKTMYLKIVSRDDGPIKVKRIIANNNYIASSIAVAEYLDFAEEGSRSLGNGITESNIRNKAFVDSLFNSGSVFEAETTRTVEMHGNSELIKTVITMSIYRQYSLKLGEPLNLEKSSFCEANQAGFLHGRCQTLQGTFLKIIIDTDKGSKRGDFLRI